MIRLMPRLHFSRLASNERDSIRIANHWGFGLDELWIPGLAPTLMRVKYLGLNWSLIQWTMMIHYCKTRSPASREMALKA